MEIKSHKRHNGSTLLITLIAAIAFVSLVMGSLLYDEGEVRDARVEVLGR